MPKQDSPKVTTLQTGAPPPSQQRQQRAHVQKAEAGLQARVKAEEAAQRAAAEHERQADKTLRPGSLEWRAKVAR